MTTCSLFRGGPVGFPRGGSDRAARGAESRLVRHVVSLVRQLRCRWLRPQAYYKLQAIGSGVWVCKQEGGKRSQTRGLTPGQVVKAM